MSNIDIRDKFKNIIANFVNKKNGNDYRSLRLNTNIGNLLYSYQRLHLINIMNSIYKYNISFDGSSTGTGKTYTSIALCKQLNLTPIIICPKSSRSAWKSVCDRFKLIPKCIVNYELLRNCKIYDAKNNKIDCPFLSFSIKNKDNKDNEYIWNIENPKNTIIIYDEVHQCKNPKSQLGKILLASKNKCKILLLSATLYDKINDFIIFGYMLGLYKWRAGKSWIKWVIRQDNRKLPGQKCSVMHDEIFSNNTSTNRGSRMDISNLSNYDDFNKNIIITDCYDINSKNKKKLNLYIEKINKINNNNLTEIIKLREKIEQYKIPIIISEIEKYYELGKSIVVFINFIKTLDALKLKLENLNLEFCIIQGGQTSEERDHQKELFQYNRIRIIICTIQSGGSSISLHDKFGSHPRVSLISPSLSSIDLIQALGRIYRAECKTQCLQKLIFCADTYEEKIADIIRQKSNNISKLNDDDLIYK